VLSSNARLFGWLSLALGGGAIMLNANLRLPGNNLGYSPEQPLAFSHRLHAGELQMDCQYCHSGARRSRHAGVPSASVCMKCHSQVTTGLDAMLEEREAASAEGREERILVSPELAVLYDAMGYDPETGVYDEASARPIEWVRVHNLQDFAWFDHRPHVARGLACETCHGPVQSMDRMRQEAPMSMGWCIECHRSQGVDGSSSMSDTSQRAADHVTTDCVNCHL
jgi:hypothetical protein